MDIKRKRILKEIEDRTCTECDNYMQLERYTKEKGNIKNIYLVCPVCGFKKMIVREV